MYERKSRTVKTASAIVAFICLAGGVFSAVSGVIALITGNVAAIASSAGGISRAIYVVSVYLMPVGALLSVAAAFFSRIGLRCGSLERHVTVTCAVAAVICFLSFVFWMIIL